MVLLIQLIIYFYIIISFLIGNYRTNMILIDSKELNIQKFFYDKSKELSLLILFINNNIYISKFFDEFDKNEKYISNGNKLENKEEKNNQILTGDNQKVKDESINCISSENNEQTKINSIENIHRWEKYIYLVHFFPHLKNFLHTLIHQYIFQFQIHSFDYY